jgi:glycosyltransferase involved in cell wall biosynthesis
VPQAGWVRTVHHGLPKHLLTPQPVEPRYLACLGRISPEKAFDRAIRIAARCGMPLKIAAKVDNVDRDYFETEIRPLLDTPQVDYIGEICDAEKSAFLSGAAALLVPIDWPEPFGLVMIEAMACGTPVIAFNRGSVPEVVEDGVTGFIVEDEASAVQAVGRIGRLSRDTVRRRFEERFTARRMANDYLALYGELIAATEEPRPKLMARLRAVHHRFGRAWTVRAWPVEAARSVAGRVSGSRKQTKIRPQAAMDASTTNVRLLPK